MRGKGEEDKALDGGGLDGGWMARRRLSSGAWANGGWRLEAGVVRVPNPNRRLYSRGGWAGPAGPLASLLWRRAWAWLPWAAPGWLDWVACLAGCWAARSAGCWAALGWPALHSLLFFFLFLFQQ